MYLGAGESDAVRGLHSGVLPTATGAKINGTGGCGVGIITKDRAASLSVGSGAYADLSELSSITINTLREAFAMQQFLERLAVGGNRYTEIIYSMFGVKSPDARLQRPEFLGHGQTCININPVEQTAASSETSPQGNLAAYAVFRGEHHAFSYSATEHMIILGLLSIRADLTYQQPLWKQWSYKTREELYWPQFAHLGEQVVYTREIDCRGTDSDSVVFALS